MIYSEDRFRPDPQYPVYPPYHKGLYLEDYFYSRFLNEPEMDRSYIGVSWTTLYCDNRTEGLQAFLDSLPPGKYFTVCQHDDGPRERLPNDTLVFSCSQSTPKPKYIQIPVVASSIGKREDRPRDLFASFVGSYTHKIRREMVKSLYENEKYLFFFSYAWTPQVPKDKLDLHIEFLRRSIFALCPRGYGNTSFRMYEAMQLGAVPVYISDDFCLPWSDEIDWNRLAILINSRDIEHIDYILSDVTQMRISDMATYAQSIYDNYFTMDGVYNNILKRVR